jgi:hypothetical protein
LVFAAVSIRLIRNWLPVGLLVLISIGGCRKDEVQEDVAVGTASHKIQLDPAKQKLIWDAEHVTFEFEYRFGKAFLASWKTRDRESMAAHCNDGFIGTHPSASATTEKQQADVSEKLWKSELTGDHEIDADGLADYLVGLLDPFEQLDSIAIRVTRIERQHDSENSWWVQFMIAIRGRSAGGQLAINESIHEIEFTFSSDETIATERILRSWRVRSVSLRTTKRSLFREVTSEYGLDQVSLPDNWTLEPHRAFSYRFQLAVDDYDLDGYADIAVSSYDGHPILLKSIRGRRFEDVAPLLELKDWSRAAEQPPPNKLVNNVVAWVDYNNDGYPDLLMGPYFYRNNKGNSFVDVTQESGLQMKRDPMGVAVVDYNQDGLLDLYIYYEVSEELPSEGEVRPWIGDDLSGASNQLWQNNGDGSFRDVTQASRSGAGKRKTTAVNWFYFDDDHYPDLYLANDFGTNVLLRNKGDGTFEDISTQTGTSDYSTSMGVATGDLDNDGYPEIYIANMFSKMGRRIIAQVEKDDYPGSIYEQIKGSCAGNRLYRRTGAKQRWEELSAEMGINRVGWAFSPAMFDLDGDGWLDIYASTGFMSFDRRKPDG